MIKKETAIVGGGIGGLVTALLLSKEKERHISIYEKNDQFGGRLTYERHGDYKVDQGPTIVLLPEMLLSILEEGGISRESIPLVKCDPLYDVHFKNGKTFTKYTDTDRQIEELNAVFPGNERGYHRFISDMRIRFLQGKAQFLEKSFVNKRTFFSGKNLHTLMKLKAYQNVKKMMSNYFNDPQLIEAYTLQTLYIGGHPQQSPAMYSLVSYSEHEHGIWYLKGGYAHLVEIILQTLERRGVSLHTNAEVDHISLHSNRVDAIRVNQKYQKVDELILNGDFPIMDDLLPKEKRLRRAYTPSSGCLLLYMGLEKNYPNRSMHQFFMSENFDKHMKQVFDDKQLPDDPSFYTFHPSLIDDSLAPKGKGVLYTLIPVPAGEDVDWSQKQHLIDYVIDQMEERGFPHLRKNINWMTIRTPEQAQKEGLYAGGSFGIAPTLFQSGVFRPQMQPYSIDDLYAVGASVHPGGGVPIVMQGAKILANHLQYRSTERHNYKRGV
ncbi:phytoene desaturase [Halobacillus yeomjeoni]|uniref:phytoene desaturase family protein n=1 Tax=Halobacillus yeomjeoni TaxID=311194 RepID=UPI001CD3CA75|nr:phytoene desaturase family protein [Halobacillus yeomjeoni]MCA0983682.1 phytoene desaturase [Halobacillus yeomjeoni]